MLEQLWVKNLALSSSLEIDLEHGMIAVTGETGAGKSLIIDALSLALGGKSSSSMIRDGKDRLEVSATFSLNDCPKALEKVNALDLENGENTVVLRRVIARDGRSKAYINDRPSVLANVKSLAGDLVSIHGQHESVKLMDEEVQLSLVDVYAKDAELLKSVNSAFYKYAKLRSELNELAQKQRQGALEYKSRRYDLDLLKKLDLNAGDYEKLELDFDKQMHLSKLKGVLGTVYNFISGDEAAVLGKLNSVNDELLKLISLEPKLKEINEALENAASYLDDAKERASDILSGYDEISTIDIEEKMSSIHDLARRFGVLPQELYKVREELENSIEEFLSLKEKINLLTLKVKEARDEYERLSDELSEVRVKAALKMEKEVSERIKSLAMPDAVFKIEIEKNIEIKPQLNGRDSAKFLFSANLGQEPKELKTVASGGELSRLALAIEVLSSGKNSTPTLIFDEVDSGISGRTAAAVGKLLHELGNAVQVIAVTHLPQVAASAHSQLLVSKFNRDDGVVSEIKTLDHAGRVEEISRMIGGNVITEATRKSARELLGQFCRD